MDAHQYYARLLTALGRYPEALAEINRARELDPRSADLGVPLFGILEKRGQYDEALRVLHSSLELDGDAWFIRRGIATLHRAKSACSGRKTIPASTPSSTTRASASCSAR